MLEMKSDERLSEIHFFICLLLILNVINQFIIVSWKHVRVTNTPLHPTFL